MLFTFVPCFIKGAREEMRILKCSIGLFTNCWNMQTVQRETRQFTFVLGVSDRNLSDKLQMHPDLTFDSAAQQVRQLENVKKQLADQRTENVDAVRFKQRGPGRQKGASSSRGKAGPTPSSKKTGGQICGRGERGPHSR